MRASSAGSVGSRLVVGGDGLDPSGRAAAGGLTVGVGFDRDPLEAMGAGERVDGGGVGDEGEGHQQQQLEGALTTTVMDDDPEHDHGDPEALGLRDHVGACVEVREADQAEGAHGEEEGAGDDQDDGDHGHGRSSSGTPSPGWIS
jgi:hypothetical protein